LTSHHNLFSNLRNTELDAFLSDLKESRLSRFHRYYSIVTDMLGNESCSKL
jgi:hypothetical protein